MASEVLPRDFKRATLRFETGYKLLVVIGLRDFGSPDHIASIFGEDFIVLL
jgi:hypothetical protein